MNILLIEPPEQVPPRPSLYPKVLPRGLLITSASLKQAGHHAGVLDLRCLNESPRAIGRVCEYFVPDLIGISVHGVPNLPSAKACISSCKQLWSEVPIIAGGFLVKTDPSFVRGQLGQEAQLFSGDSDIDVAILHQSIEAGQIERFFPGQSPNGYDTSYSVPEIDYNDLLSPYSDPLTAYLDRDFEPHIETQRGCPYQCRYCGTYPRGPARTFYRDPAETVEEMIELQAGLVRSGSDKRLFWIADETFTSDREHTARFCEELLRRVPGIGWRAQTRADLVDPEILGLMKKSGCRQISFGIESLSDDVLKRVSKGADAHTGIVAMSMARRAGLSVRAILIIGLPGDSYTSLRKTFELLREFGPEACQVYIYHPIPGSPEVDSTGISISAEDASLSRETAFLGFLESPESGVGDLGRSEIVRWFLAANHVFPTRLNSEGDRRQLDRIVDGWREANYSHRQPLRSDNRAARLALLELSICCTGEFTYEEALERASKVSGLEVSEVKQLPGQGLEMCTTPPPDQSKNSSAGRNPRLRQDSVIIRTTSGGLICDAALNGNPQKDDLLRRTFVLSKNAYEILLRCDGHYDVDDIALALSRVLGSSAIPGKTVLSTLEQIRNYGFLE